ncbi:hypothetical protein E3P96_02200 [Wallemia ichthyophaga]|nr:hypothetical protein E3P96_02200 [Wallemia ichthyophaga]
MTVGPNRRLNNQLRRQLEKQLKKVKVETNHIPNRKQPFKIQDVSVNNANTYTFEEYNGRKLSNTAYLKSTHNFVLRLLQLPVIGKSMTFFSMELLNIIPGQIHPGGVLNSAQTKDIMSFCKRLKNYRGQAMSLSRNNPVISEFGFKIDSNAIECSASVIKPSSLEYGNRLQI